ncbi:MULTISPECIES: permease [unclassified Caballeronia]|uniref:permease n=1 Tax=unclassified Caballeronia TaxID=2646786 RepID=UPI00285B327C|nr:MULTISPECIES: permease [unclassified Caballeronia]MDR5739389.1 permease [Caballeronia sp. LZ016]MDR5807877.1 permease [Caballeronia sp. LZ019]
MTTLRQPRVALGWMVFLLIAVAGLFYVKWFPYYNRAFVAASQHSIGKSILMGTSASAPEPSWQAALDYAMAYGRAIWQAMVLGLLLGSAVQALIPPRWVARALGEHNFGSVVNGGLMSLPGMMCTCCAAPVVAGLRARQAAPGAAIAFWLGNTVLNPAALVFMGFVLGWQWTGLRLVLGVLMVFGLGCAVNRMVTPAQAAASREALSKLIQEDDPGTAFTRWLKILGRMTLRLVPEYIVLVLLLGAARAWLFPHIGPDIGNAVLWIVAFAVAGTLFVIPTAGEVPIIQAMLSLGMATGPAGALLMTLPPVSVPSLVMLGKSFPRKVLVFVAVSVVGFGIAGGVVAGWLF